MHEMSSKPQLETTSSTGETMDHHDTGFGSDDDVREVLNESFSNPFGYSDNTATDSIPQQSTDVSTASNTVSQQVLDDLVVPNTAVDNIIAHKESIEVRRYKIIVSLMILVMCVVVAVCVHYFIERSERIQFEDSFKMSAAIVLEGVGSAIARTLTPLDTLALSLVSYARATNNTWPFVTFPDYGLRLSKLLPFTDAMLIEYMPIVQPEQKEEWELYCSEHNQWVNQSIKLQDSWDKYTGPIIFEWEPTDKIFSDTGDLESNISRIMAPSWQVYPAIPKYYSYNWDYLSQVFPEYLYACMETHNVILSEPKILPHPGDKAAQAEAELWAKYFADFSPGEESYEPVLDIVYPIVDDVSSVELSADEDYDPKNHTLVGMIAASAYWRKLIQNILQPEVHGMILVINNECTISFTYQIDGPNVTYLGLFDKHDKKYDHLLVSAELIDISRSMIVDSVYSGAKVNKDFCQYSLHLYPSDGMKADFATMKSLTYTAISCFLFLGLAITFIIYDSKVERRQQKVLSSAVRTSEIVSSLFPASVQDQLYACAGNGDGQQEAEKYRGSPIATLYPATTVMFADIKGFTAWSTTREPTQVFQLLETLYCEFDKLTKLLGVFKVETIGDTYVAVAGLPTPRENHAIVMAIFAIKCIDKMAQVVKELEESLGKGTTELSLRVGLHSGPTTAGVLRGDKARFQLFGDTVNTASRMESTGESHKIQVSEATAHLIQSDGKGHWLNARPDKIIPKGKGEMQTYWCDPSTKDWNAEQSIPKSMSM